MDKLTSLQQTTTNLLCLKERLADTSQQQVFPASCYTTYTKANINIKATQVK